MQVFFYGMFMDINILKKNGVNVVDHRTGYLENYTLMIGERATLVKSEGEKVYGLVMEIDDVDVQMIYSESSVSDYLTNDVRIVTGSGNVTMAKCFMLPPGSLKGSNRKYATDLHKLATTLGFPDSYLKKIEVMISESSD